MTTTKRSKTAASAPKRRKTTEEPAAGETPPEDREGGVLYVRGLTAREIEELDALTEERRGRLTTAAAALGAGRVYLSRNAVLVSIIREALSAHRTAAAAAPSSPADPSGKGAS